jgi:uncharacterized protein YcaQ
MKADRQAGVLRVNAAWHESQVDPDATAEAISPALVDMREWMGLDRIEIVNRGNLAKALTTTRLP